MDPPFVNPALVRLAASRLNGVLPRLQPEVEYFFKHALIQEAIYESLLLSRRRELHRHVGEAIETLFVDRLEEYYGLLAYHYARAEDWAKSQEYLFRAGDQAGRLAADAEALAHYQQAVAAHTRVFGDRWDPLQRAALERKMGEALFRRGEQQQAREHLRSALAHLGSPYPASDLEVRLGLLRQLGRQARHRLLPARLPKPDADVEAAVEEQAWIYEQLAWMDYFTDPERCLLDALLRLNFSEDHGFALGIAGASMAVGVVCDVLGAFSFAGGYHHRAVALAEALGHPLAIGHACLGIGYHEHHHLGDWATAQDHYRRGAAAYWQAGHLHGWGAINWKLTGLLRLAGSLAAGRELGAELVRVGQEGADHQVWGWGLQELGRISWQTGRLKEAESYLLQARELLESVPDHASVAAVGSDLGQCYLRQGRPDEAREALEASVRLIDERNLRDFLCTPVRNGLAEVYLLDAEQASRSERAAALNRAERACQAALKQSRLVREGAPAAERLHGTLRWLAGQRAGAERWWRRSFETAETLGVPYELGLTCLEIGRRLEDRKERRRAVGIFTELGAETDLARAQSLLGLALPEL
jgi:tetratricopeptide (TPR) repeat protein